MENETNPPAPDLGADAQDTRPEQHQQSPELLKLAREMRAIDAEPAAAAASAGRAVALSMETQNRGELHAALIMARDAALPLIAMASERKAVMLSVLWSDATLEAIAKNGGAVLALHGIALSALTGGITPYIGLALALGAPAFGTYKVLRSADPAPAEVVG